MTHWNEPEVNSVILEEASGFLNKLFGDITTSGVLSFLIACLLNK